MIKGKYPIIFLGLGIGTVSYFLSGAAFLFLVFGIVSYFIYNASPAEDRRFILTVLIIGFLIRIFLAVLAHALNYLDGYHGISGDDLLYTVKSWALVYKWKGLPYNWVNDLSGSSPKFGLNPFTWILALFYKGFGFHPVVSKFINCIIGSVIGWLSYLIARELFDRRAGKVSMLIVTFYPSLIRWSIANLKDSFAIMLFMVCIYISIAVIYRRVRGWKLLALAVSMVLICNFAQILYFILISISSSLAVFFRILNFAGNRALKTSALVMGVIGFLAVFYYFFYVNTGPVVKYLYRFEEQQAVVAKSDYAGYYLYSRDYMDDLNRQKVSLSGLAEMAFRNVSYFMLTPFPWQMNSSERMLAFPQMVLWYILLVLSFFGFIKLVVKRFEAAFMIGVVLSLGILVCSLAEGNVGAAFRHRDIFTPLVIILASTVAHDMFFRREKNDIYRERGMA